MTGNSFDPKPGTVREISQAQYEAGQIKLPKGELRTPTTYPQYLAYCMEMQRRYIAEERKRMAKLQRAWDAYRAKASALELHPLDQREITARGDELRTMLANIYETHGDTPGQRALWEARQREGGK